MKKMNRQGFYFVPQLVCAGVAFHSSRNRAEPRERKNGCKHGYKHRGRETEGQRDGQTVGGRVSEGRCAVGEDCPDHQPANLETRQPTALPAVGFAERGVHQEPAPGGEQGREGTVGQSAIQVHCGKVGGETEEAGQNRISGEMERVSGIRKHVGATATDDTRRARVSKKIWKVNSIILFQKYFDKIINIVSLNLNVRGGVKVHIHYVRGGALHVRGDLNVKLLI